jgi:hypothetical protein
VEATLDQLLLGLKNQKPDVTAVLSLDEKCQMKIRATKLFPIIRVTTPIVISNKFFSSEEKATQLSAVPAEAAAVPT